MAHQDSGEKVTVTIDGIPLQVPKGTLLVEAAKLAGIEIPVYCYHTKLGPAGLCRICLVEIEGMPKLQIACNTPVTDGMVVRTQGDKVTTGRATVLELFLVNHPLDCPICDKGGECDLQDYAMAYGRGTSDLADPKERKPKAVDLGPTIVLDEERCIVCQRCVRFDALIPGERRLVVKERGHRDIIATATGEPYRHHFTGNVTELCPVGALTSKTYRFLSRPWDLQRTETSCVHCSVGCRQYADVRYGTLLRTMSVPGDDAISDGWLCDRGRYNIGFLSARERLTQPLHRRDGAFVAIDWEEALSLWADALRAVLKEKGAAGVGVIGGGRLLNEEAYLLQHLFRSLGIRNIDWRAGRQRQATPGNDGGDLAALERAQAIVVLGASPGERAPVLDLRIRKAVMRNGARLVRIAPLEAPPPIPATDVATVEEAMAAIGGAGRIAIVWDGVDVELARRLVAACDAQGAERFTYITGEQGNARGAEAMGMLPSSGPGYASLPEGGLSIDAMLRAAADGAIGALAIFGANPLLRYPDAALVRAALERVPFVAVADLFLTETARQATLVLPAAHAYEKRGTIINATGSLLPVEPAVAAPDGVLSDLEIAIGLAQQLGVALPSEEEVHRAVVAAAAAMPELTLGDVLFGDAARARDVAADDRRNGESAAAIRLAVETALFTGGGTCAHDERLAALRARQRVRLAVDDARVLGVRDGDRVDIVVGERALRDLPVAVDASLRAGTAVLIDGIPDRPANLFLPGEVVQMTRARAAVAVEA